MSFVTMDDKAYIDGLIGTYELSNVSLLREIYIDAYLTSAENYKTLRAEVDSPERPLPIAILSRMRYGAACWRTKHFVKRRSWPWPLKREFRKPTGSRWSAM